MKTNNQKAQILEDVKINIKIKLSALWIALMFFIPMRISWGFTRLGISKNSSQER
jgi:hypothetical protein